MPVPNNVVKTYVNRHVKRSVECGVSDCDLTQKVWTVDFSFLVIRFLFGNFMAYICSRSCK